MSTFITFGDVSVTLAKISSITVECVELSGMIGSRVVFKGIDRPLMSSGKNGEYLFDKPMTEDYVTAILRSASEHFAESISWRQAELRFTLGTGKSIADYPTTDLPIVPLRVA